MHEFISVNLQYLCNVINEIKYFVEGGSMRVLYNPPTSVALGGARGNEGLIQPTDVGGFGGARGNEGLILSSASVDLGQGK